MDNWEGIKNALQFSDDGKLKHLIEIEGINKDLIESIFDLTESIIDSGCDRHLKDKLFVNIFFERSTRTRLAFESTAKQLGADVVNLENTNMAGDLKGESIKDTIMTVGAMGASGVAIRDSHTNSIYIAAHTANQFNMPVINGGAGCVSHPTQALTDAYTLRKEIGDLTGANIAIIGDVLHSRVARSDAQIFKTLGANVRLIGPSNFCPSYLEDEMKVPIFTNMTEGLIDVDAAVLLRIQNERLPYNFNLLNKNYFNDYGMTIKRLEQQKSSFFILHPGPINRGMEIDDEAAECKQSLILKQVTNGMAIRKAVLLMLC